MQSIVLRRLPGKGKLLRSYQKPQTGQALSETTVGEEESVAAAVQNPCSSSSSLPPPFLSGEFTSHIALGVVHAPQFGLLYGEPMWSCKLLVSQIGRSAINPEELFIGSQESYDLRCRGEWVHRYCRTALSEGALVHVVSKLVRTPRYVPMQSDYAYNTELLVTEQYGSITRVAQL